MRQSSYDVTFVPKCTLAATLDLVRACSHKRTRPGTIETINPMKSVANKMNQSK